MSSVEEQSKDDAIPPGKSFSFHSPAQTASSYYDLPLPDSAPDYEVRICEYLKRNKINMADPSARLTQPHTKGRRMPKTLPKLFLKRGSNMIRANFCNLVISTEV